MKILIEDNNEGLLKYTSIFLNKILVKYYGKYETLIRENLRSLAKSYFSDNGVEQPFEQEEQDDYEFILLENDYNNNQFIIGVAWLEMYKNPRKDNTIMLDLAKENEFIQYDLQEKYGISKIRICKDSLFTFFDYSSKYSHIALECIFSFLLDSNNEIEQRLKSYEWKDEKARNNLANFPISWSSFNIKNNIYERSKNYQPNINLKINSTKYGKMFQNNKSECFSILGYVFLENFCRNFIEII